MSDSSFWSRVKNARLFQVLAIYAAASWVMLQVVVILRDALQLPPWIAPVAIILLAIGFVVILATAWVQSHPLMPQREASDEVPSDWELDVTGIKESVASGRLPHLNWARAILGGVVAFSLLFGLAGLYVVIQDRGESFSPPEAVAGVAPGIAVLPFTVDGEGLEAMREGMVSLLSTGLDGAGGLRTIAPGTVFARWDEHVSGSRTPELPTALEIARETGARYVLIGSAVSIGSSMRVLAEVYDVKTGERLGQAQVEGSPEDVLPVVDRLGVEVLRVVLQGQGQLPEIDMASITTESPDALRAYLEGEMHFRHFDVGPAREAYTRAVEIDSLFALAHYRLARTHGWLGGVRELQRHHLDRAARLSNRLPKREALLVNAGRAQFLDIVDGLDALRQAVRLHPDDGEIWYQLGETQLHVPGAMATAEEVETSFERAVELDPLNARYLVHYTEFAWMVRADSLEAKRRLKMYERATSPEDANVRGFQLALDIAFGDSGAQRDALARLASAGDEVVLSQALDMMLVHPRYSRASDVAELKWERNARLDWDLFVVNTSHGRFHQLVENAQDPRLLPWERGYQLYIASDLGFPIPTELLEKALEAVEVEEATSPLAAIDPGLYAADRGRWSDHDSIVDGFERRSALATSVGDSLDGQRWALAAQALRAYGLWRRGGAEAVLDLVDDPNVWGPLWQDQWWVQGRIYQELGRYRDAERVYRTFHHGRPSADHPLAQRELGKVYEALGEYDKAREAYEYFVEYWSDADPELQPMVEEARQAIIRLTPLQRE